MTILICSCQDRKTIKCKFVSNYKQIPDIETMHFVPERTLLERYLYFKLKGMSSREEKKNGFSVLTTNELNLLVEHTKSCK
jgi:hypothetical protein